MSSQVPFHPRPLGRGWDGDLFAEGLGHGPSDQAIDLTATQLDAVAHRGGPLLILAGAGSGKTRVLTSRIAHLIADHGVHPQEILAITFTNKAAGEMRERVMHRVGRRARFMWVSTFHSACVRILRADAGAIGYTSNFSIYDSDDAVRLITKVCKDQDLDPKRFPPRLFSNAISNLKKICDQHLAGRYNITIIDLMKDPAAAQPTRSSRSRR